MVALFKSYLLLSKPSNQVEDKTATSENRCDHKRQNNRSNDKAANWEVIKATADRHQTQSNEVKKTAPSDACIATAVTNTLLSRNKIQTKYNNIYFMNKNSRVVLLNSSHCIQPPTDAEASKRRDSNIFVPTIRDYKQVASQQHAAPLN